MTGSDSDLWYSNQTLDHYNLQYANSTIYWTGMDSENAFNQHCQDPITYNQLKALGWTASDCISYVYNHQGFRCEQFDNRPAGLALGCSFTEGVGIAQDQTWVSVLAKYLNMHIWNLGIGGAAMDTVFRVAAHFLPVLNPKFVIVCTPTENRFEYKNNFGNFITVLPELVTVGPFANFAKEWFLSDENSRINYQRNLLAIKFLCHKKNIPLLCLSSQQHLPLDRCARDLAHPGVEANQRFAQAVQERINNSTFKFNKDNHANSRISH